MFGDIDGMHVPNSFHNFKLWKDTLSTDDEGFITYDNEKIFVDVDDAGKYSLDDMGTYLIFYLVGPIVEQDNSNMNDDSMDMSREEDAFDDIDKGSGSSGKVSGNVKSGGNSSLNSQRIQDETSMDSEIFHIFDGIVSPTIASIALKIFFMFKPVEKKTLGNNLRYLKIFIILKCINFSRDNTLFYYFI
jgi:hypothetical protein